MLKKLFCEWIKSIELPKSPLYCIPQNALYLNFNYTKILEDTYKIDPANILHIHGSADSEIEFGNPDVALFNYKSEDSRVLEVKDEINRALKSVHKDIVSIISRNQFFFSYLDEIQKIYILGHSMNEIDEPYFLKIKKSISSNTHWIASYYNESDRQRAKELLSDKLYIDSFEIKKLDSILKIT
ncbi:MAG: bacteriophage abortive infection AbiH family protein [Lentimicrobiaceae bacterium]|nr:bacteriophage abortive infection AbiH family protein [Lentimicrobiaceae bacterium]